mgnify:CR=1 FL=1
MQLYLKKDEYGEYRIPVVRQRPIFMLGAPGVGKTFAAKRLAYSIMGMKDDSRVEFIQFHQNYSY